MSLVKSILKATKNEYGSIVSDGIVGDLCGFISTGSYSLNALISGSIYGGIPSNKVTAIAGPSGVGKTFYVLQTIKSFLDADPENEVAYFESESALTKKMLEDLKIDTSRIAFLPVTTIQQFRFQALKVLETYEASYGVGSTDPKILMVLDSLGNLSTTKEVTDMAEGKETLDMTRAKLIRGAFRVLTLKMGVLNVPLLITNHTYDTIDMFSKRVMGGGCLVADTDIIMANGDFKAIQDVLEGEQVLTMEGPGTVAQLHNFNNKDVYKVKFGDGHVIECSADHKFLTTDGKWMSIVEINESNNNLDFVVI